MTSCNTLFSRDNTIQVHALIFSAYDLIFCDIKISFKLICQWLLKKTQIGSNIDPICAGWCLLILIHQKSYVTLDFILSIWATLFDSCCIIWPGYFFVVKDTINPKKKKKKSAYPIFPKVGKESPTDSTKLPSWNYLNIDQV